MGFLIRYVLVFRLILNCNSSNLYLAFIAKNLGIMYCHESVKGVKITNEIAALEEIDLYMYNYKNQGLYPKHGVDVF